MVNVVGRGGYSREDTFTNTTPLLLTIKVNSSDNFIIPEAGR